MGEERYGYRKEKQILVVVLVVAGLAFASYVVAQTFNAPSVNEVSTSVETEAEGPPAITVANVSANESGIPEWWYWSKEDFEELQWYANQTEIIWSYNKTTGERESGTAMVAGEPLWSGQRQTTEFANQWSTTHNPLEYFTIGERRGNCIIVPYVTWYLFKIKGEVVKTASAENIDYNLDPEWIGVDHGWTEWIDKEGKEWAIDGNEVISLEQWYKRYNWTVCWSQEEGPGLPPP